MNARALLCALALGLLAACGGGKGGKLAVDTPILPYVAPDIDEITGIDPDAPPKTPPKAAEPAPPPAPAPAAPPVGTPPAKKP